MRARSRGRAAAPALRRDLAEDRCRFRPRACVASWLPGAAGGGNELPVSRLVVAGALIGALTTGVLFVALRYDLRAVIGYKG